MRRIALLVPLLLGACATADAPPAPPPYEAIAFELNSWGIPIDSWRIASDGSGSYSEAVRAEGASFRDYSLERHDLALSPRQFADAARIAASLPPQPDEDGCRSRVTDMPYGTLRLTREGVTQEIRFSSNCRDAGNLAFIGKLQELDALVGAWGKQAPVTRITRPD